MSDVKYKCVKKCFYRNRLWVPGETLVPEEGEKLPKHFKVAKTVKVEVEVSEEEAQTLKDLQNQDKGVNADDYFGTDPNKNSGEGSEGEGSEDVPVVSGSEPMSTDGLFE